MAKLVGGNFCSNVFKAIKRQLRSVFTSTFTFVEPTPRDPNQKHRVKLKPLIVI